MAERESDRLARKIPTEGRGSANPVPPGPAADMVRTETTSHEHLILDPERLSDCVDLVHALQEETGVQLEPEAVREALRKLARAQW